jgi:hypothetical protein
MICRKDFCVVNCVIACVIFHEYIFHFICVYIFKYIYCFYLIAINWVEGCSIFDRDFRLSFFNYVIHYTITRVNIYIYNNIVVSIIISQ